MTAAVVIADPHADPSAESALRCIRVRAPSTRIVILSADRPGHSVPSDVLLRVPFSLVDLDHAIVRRPRRNLLAL